MVWQVSSLYRKVPAVTNRERILAIMAGENPDRIPWIPRLQIWYDAHVLQGTLPAEYEGFSLR